MAQAASLNTIGGVTTASRNVISGNTSAGIWITGSGVNQNSVLGNFIGLNAAGTAAVANTFVGMYLIAGASNNSVTGNVLSGNTSEGLRLTGVGTSGNTTPAVDVEKHQQLDAALDKLRARYGRKANYFGTLQESRD